MADAPVGIEGRVTADGTGATEQSHLGRTQVAVVGGQIRDGGLAETQLRADAFAQFL